MKARDMVVFSIALVFLTATPVFACIPRHDVTVALPVFLVLILVKFALTGFSNLKEGKYGGGISLLLGLAFIMFAFSIQLYEIIYAWVIYEILMLCVEFLTRQEESLKDFYFNHSERVWMAGLLIGGGIAAKLLYYSQQGWWFFIRIYSEYFGYFTFYLVAGTMIFLWLLFMQKFQKRYGEL